MVGESPGVLRPKREVDPEGPLTSRGMVEGERDGLETGWRLGWLKNGRNDSPWVLRRPQQVNGVCEKGRGCAEEAAWLVRFDGRREKGQVNVRGIIHSGRYND
jgi:hypothetical protein